MYNVIDVLTITNLHKSLLLRSNHILRQVKWQLLAGEALHVYIIIYTDYESCIQSFVFTHNSQWA